MGVSSLNTLPFFTSRAAVTIPFGVKKFRHPSSSPSPNTPHDDSGGASFRTGNFLNRGIFLKSIGPIEAPPSSAVAPLAAFYSQNTSIFVKNRLQCIWLDGFRGVGEIGRRCAWVSIEREASPVQKSEPELIGVYERSKKICGFRSFGSRQKQALEIETFSAPGARRRNCRS